jgi:hypothetical protein
MKNAFDTLWSSCPDARASVRIDVLYSTDNALCSGIGMERENSEHGLFRIASATVRLKQETEDQNYALNLDRVVEVKLPDNDWVKMRVAGRRVSAGVIVLSLETLYE